MSLRYFILIFLLLITPVTALGKTIHLEKVYQKSWCGEIGGQTEVVLSDRTRVDCLTDTYAVEVDFARKWAEAIGQALFYSGKTGKKPGILIIVEENQQRRYLKRLNLTIKKFDLPIRVWVMGPNDLK